MGKEKINDENYLIIADILNYFNRLKKYDKLIEFCDLLIDYDPYSPFAYNAKAEALVDSNHKGAHRWILTSLQSFPNNPDLLLSQARFYITKGMNPEAVEICKKILKKDNKNYIAMLTIATAYVGWDKNEEAEKYIKKLEKSKFKKEFNEPLKFLKKTMKGEFDTEEDEYRKNFKKMFNFGLD